MRRAALRQDRNRVLKSKIYWMAVLGMPLDGIAAALDITPSKVYRLLGQMARGTPTAPAGGPGAPLPTATAQAARQRNQARH